ncbi:unnamed protein product [Blepharisma stoltei]|uniref:2-oxoisovalerate dehydrogenase subunit alpha n=1 Tax=Blepharisma stoltei TaxID=1481888 RepID=A0AAU9J7P4_9CILI|nr:unnamed protein product [Blepharisma stoltei]
MLSHIRRCFSFSQKLTFTDPNALKIPTFRCIDENGLPLKGAEVYIDAVSKSLLMDIYKTMVEVREFDTIFYDLQRQGKVSFYMQNTGEEGLQAGTAAALDKDDWICPQYRELGLFFWRGFDIQLASHQMYGNKLDLGEGKQMPVHYGCNAAKIQHVSSPLATQIPQAAGLGYGLKIRGEQNICVCFYGEGAASEGDAHAGLNFAATTKAHTLFVCRNNKYAISTPITDQFASDGIAPRGVGYGMPSIRADGNDVFAAYNAVKESRKLVLSTPGPVLLEFMTYRVGHHSTSDDSTRYRTKEEIEFYKNVDNPILRTEKFMMHAGWLDFDPVQYAKDVRERVLKAKTVAEHIEFPKWTVMFSNVYDKLTPELERQQEEMKKHLEKYGDKYHIEKHEAV